MNPSLSQLFEPARWNAPMTDTTDAPTVWGEIDGQTISNPLVELCAWIDGSRAAGNCRTAGGARARLWH